MLPFMMFDGAKIWKWNKFVWAGMVAIGVGLLAIKSL